MPRAIVRFSIDGEASNATGNDVRRMLEDQHADRIGTGAFELEDPDLEFVLSMMQDVLERMKAPRGGGHLDHFWLYIDRTG